MITKEPVFILGTGRCGSTLISNMLNASDKVLSISEFFSFVTDLGNLTKEFFAPEEIDTMEFWKKISTCYPIQNIMLRYDLAMSEVLYPDFSTSKFSYQTGVPAISQVVLPHITPHYDALYEEIEVYISSQGSASVHQHYAKLFNWLKERFGKEVWVERSGGGLRVVQQLFEAFPNAKFVHLIRDGRDCAMSMSKHRGFRMVLLVFKLVEFLGVNPFYSDDRTNIKNLPNELRDLLPENFNATVFENCQIPPSLYAHYWSHEIINGLSVLDQVPQHQLFTMWYEDLIENPMTVINDLMSFIDPSFINTPWLNKARSMVSVNKSSWKHLPDHEQKELNEACAPGFEALKQYNLLRAGLDSVVK